MDTLLFTLNLFVLLVGAVYAHGTRNVAIGKTASMSSNHREYKWLAQTAVDGNVGNNSMLSDTCFHTTKEYQPWWRVDLHQDYYITSVVVYNRLDCCANQARKIKLTIGKSLDSMSQAGHLDGGFTTTHTFTVDPPLVGRFVQLQLNGITEFFHLCEVEVMAYPSGTYNVATGKTASQSSNFSTLKYHASTAVDGYAGDNRFASDSFFSTNKEYQPWWRVDLHQDYYITSVVVYNRLDCCGNRARNIKLTIGKTLDSMSQAGYLDVLFTTPHTFTIDPPLVGRFVQLQLKGITEIFHLCEVEVMAYPSGTYNVAFGKTASQSSNYNTSKYNATAAVDGNVGDNAFASDSCFCTAKEYQPWWRVDLHQNYYITSVVMHYQLDCCGNQARNIKLTIGKSLVSMSQAGYLDGGFTTHTFTIDPPLVGRFVQLQLKGITEFFHLCEVEVMAYPSEFPINTTVISGIFGGVCAMVILGATGILLTRKYSKGSFSKADEKSEETSRNPDAPVDTVPSARDSEIYTEIEETSDCQAKRTGETSFTVQTTDPSQYEELRASVSNTYTKLDRTMNENICK